MRQCACACGSVNATRSCTPLHAANALSGSHSLARTQVRTHGCAHNPKSWTDAGHFTDCSLPDLPLFVSVARCCRPLVGLWFAVTEPSVEANPHATYAHTVSPTANFTPTP